MVRICIREYMRAYTCNEERKYGDKPALLCCPTHTHTRTHTHTHTHTTEYSKDGWLISSTPTMFLCCAFCDTRAAKICVLTNDGRSVVGILRGFDQTTNLILEDSHERVYSTTVRTTTSSRPLHSHISRQKLMTCVYMHLRVSHLD